MTNTSSNPQLALISANNGISEIQFGDGADAVRGNIIYRAGSAGDALCFNGYNNTERLRITSSGKVGINTTTASSTLQIYAANDGEGTATGQITLKDTANYNQTPTGGVVFQGHHTAQKNSQAIFSGCLLYTSDAADE